MPEPRPTSPAPGLTDGARRSGTTLFCLPPLELDRFFPNGFETPSDPSDQRRSAEMGDPNVWREQIEALQPDVLVTGWSTPRLPPELSATRGGSVRYICHVTGSIRHVVDRDLIAEGLLVTNWGRMVAPMVAEHALLLTLSCLRNQARWPEVMAGPDSIHKSHLATRTLHGKRVALHGFGSISQALVRLLQPFGCAVSAYSHGMPACYFEELKVKESPSLAVLCRGADILISCEALTDRTRGELNATVLRELNEGAVFVNVGRGAVVNEADLVSVARDLGLRIGLDVFCDEPLPLTSPLRSLPGVVLSPHIGGPTHDAYRQCGEQALHNLDVYRRGEQPADVITPAMFDRTT